MSAWARNSCCLSQHGAVIAGTGDELVMLDGENCLKVKLVAGNNGDCAGGLRYTRRYA